MKISHADLLLDATKAAQAVLSRPRVPGKRQSVKALRTELRAILCTEQALAVVGEYRGRK